MESFSAFTCSSFVVASYLVPQRSSRESKPILDISASDSSNGVFRNMNPSPMQSFIVTSFGKSDFAYLVFSEVHDGKLSTELEWSSQFCEAGAEKCDCAA